MPELSYLHGLHNHQETEAMPGALPKGQNSPQKVPYGLYAEQLSGSSFTTKRHLNLHSWLYRIRPSVLHSEFQKRSHPTFVSAPFGLDNTPPTQMRWDPMPYAKNHLNFIEGIFTICGTGSVDLHQGAAIHLYAASRSMQNEYFYNADGEWLIVPQEGRLRFKTELGLIDLQPQEILVIPRGIKFQVELLDSQVRGYICENYGAPFRLPELGVIGANGLANPRDFYAPNAYFENSEDIYTLIAKFQGSLWEAKINHSPIDVVAWHGNYFPYKYDLSLFNTLNSVSFDHPDPSIFTVLTAPSSIEGIANVDFVIFPPRWMVAQNTFRPPYFHRNIMSEFMGLIHGKYDAKPTGFLPGGSSLHNCMSPHGPDAHSYEQAITANLQPEYYEHTLAFMFESQQVWRLTPFAYHAEFRQRNYLDCWQNLKAKFETACA